MAVWWTTHVEIASALARVLRHHKITPGEYARGTLQAEGLANLWRVVAPSKNVALEAGFLLERYRLRAAVASRSNAPFETATLDAGAPVQQSTGTAWV